MIEVECGSLKFWVVFGQLDKKKSPKPLYTKDLELVIEAGDENRISLLACLDTFLYLFLPIKVCKTIFRWNFNLGTLWVIPLFIYK